MQRMKSELSLEVARREELESELDQERQTIESVLNQMEMLELEGRSKVEEVSEERQNLEDENKRLQKCLEDERAIRLQQMFQLSRSQAEADDANKEKKKWEKAVSEMDADQQVLIREIDALRSSLEASQKLAAQQAREVTELTNQLSSQRHDTHVVRSRLLEAESDASHWLRMFEEAADSMAEDRSAFNKIVSNQQRSRTSKSGAAAMGRAPPLRQAGQMQLAYCKSQKLPNGATTQLAPAARIRRELPALLPPGSHY